MSRKLKTKQALLEHILLERKLLNNKMKKLSTEQMAWAGSMDEWSAKDVLGHLIDWEQRFISWYEAGKKGKTPETPAKGYSWQQLPALNAAGFEARKDASLDEVLAEYEASYAQILALVEAMDEDEIFTRKLYGWTGKDALLPWIVSNTSAHYKWARRNVRLTVIQKAFGEYVEKPRKQKKKDVVEADGEDNGEVVDA